VIGRSAEDAMLAVTGGVNTHRGAIWALGLLCAGAASRDDIAGAVAIAAQLASLPDLGLDPARATTSNGARVRAHYGVDGASGEAADGFPHVLQHGLPALRAARANGAGETAARLNSLVALIATLDDTCLLHRGGHRGLRLMQDGASKVIDAGGYASSSGRAALAALNDVATQERLSPGGSGDLLAATLFLDALFPEGTRPRYANTDLCIRGHPYPCTALTYRRCCVR
jgi:triphosphoribosyl-dephospho-CoA synthase